MRPVSLPQSLLNLGQVSLADGVRDGYVVQLSLLNHCKQIFLVLDLHHWHVLVLPSW